MINAITRGVLVATACAAIQSPHINDDIYTIPAGSAAVVESISEFSLEFTCGRRDESDPFQMTVEEQKGLVDFVKFIADNQDRTVYVNVRVDQECAACGCPRAEPEGKGYDGAMGYLSIDTSPANIRRQGFAGIGWGGAKMFLEGILVNVSIPEEWAVHHEIFLPRWEHLAGAQYSAGEYGAFAKFDGLFTARFHERTGVNMLHLDVMSPSDREIEQLHLIRERRSSQQQADRLESP